MFLATEPTTPIAVHGPIADHRAPLLIGARHAQVDDSGA